MATSLGKIHVIVVTPEKAVLDAQADMVILPMFDGERGIQPGHSAFVGELGRGEFRYTLAGETKRLTLHDGFAQVRTDTVTVLTTKVSV